MSNAAILICFQLLAHYWPVRYSKNVQVWGGSMPYCVTMQMLLIVLVCLSYVQIHRQVLS